MYAVGTGKGGFSGEGPYGAKVGKGFIVTQLLGGNVQCIIDRNIFIQLSSGYYKAILKTWLH